MNEKAETVEALVLEIHSLVGDLDRNCVLDPDGVELTDSEDVLALAFELSTAEAGKPVLDVIGETLVDLVADLDECLERVSGSEEDVVVAAELVAALDQALDRFVELVQDEQAEWALNGFEKHLTQIGSSRLFDTMFAPWIVQMKESALAYLIIRAHNLQARLRKTFPS